MHLEAPLVRDEDQRADQIARQQIGRELDAPEAQAERLRERAHRGGLRETRHAVDERVTAGEQRHQQALEQRALPDDDAAHLVEDPLERVLRALPSQRCRMRASSRVVRTPRQLGQAHDAAAPALDVPPTDDGVERPVAALRQHARAQRSDQRERRRLAEDHHPIDAGERGQHLGAPARRHDRAPGCP